MSLSDLIKQAREKGLISICPIGLAGKADAVFEIMGVIAKTEPMETDLDWWSLRLWLMRN